MSMKRKVGGYGYIPDLPDYRDLRLQVSAPINLPPSIDLRAQMPAIYDQGNLGSCTANAIGAAIQFERMRQKIKGADKEVPSRLFIYYNERVIEHTVREDAGAMIRDGVKSVNKLGVCDESLWPYVEGRFTKKPPTTAFKAALQDKVTKYARVNQNARDMKVCLSHGLPFVMGFTCYDAFESDKVAKTGVLNMPASGEKVVGGHAILVVGYDDASNRFIVRNSWGTSWGQKGYFTVPYEYFTNSDLADDLWNIQLVSQ